MQSQVCVPSCIKELYQIRELIENKTQHEGQNYEIVYTAIEEIERSYGRAAPSRLCKSGCVHEWNRMLMNYFPLWDSMNLDLEIKKPKRKISDKFEHVIRGASNTGELIPVDDRKEVLDKTDWSDLLEEVKSITTQEQYNEINKGKLPKKSQLINYLLSNG